MKCFNCGKDIAWEEGRVRNFDLVKHGALPMSNSDSRIEEWCAPCAKVRWSNG